MTDTLRAYNKSGFVSRLSYSGLVYHPYKQQERHKCSICWDYQWSKHRRLRYGIELRYIKKNIQIFL